MIADFASGADRILLDRTIFAGLSNPGDGALDATDFAVVSSLSEAAHSDALIVLDGSQGDLFYNENRADPGFGTFGQFASLAGNPALTETDFQIVS